MCDMPLCALMSGLSRVVLGLCVLRCEVAVNVRFFTLAGTRAAGDNLCAEDVFIRDIVFLGYDNKSMS